MTIAKAKIRADRHRKKDAKKTKDAEYAAFITAREAEIEVDDELVRPDVNDLHLVQPEEAAVAEQVKEKIKIVEKITVQKKSKLKRKSTGPQSALIPSEGRTMGMELD